MPFTVISGTFHLVGMTKAGAASGFEPDGDSMQFKPNNAKLLDRLETKIQLSPDHDRVDPASLRRDRRARAPLRRAQPATAARRHRARLPHRAARHEPGPVHAAGQPSRQAARPQGRHQRLHPLAIARCSRSTDQLRLHRRTTRLERQQHPARLAIAAQEPQLQVGRRRQRLPAVLRHPLWRPSRHPRGRDRQSTRSEQRPLGQRPNQQRTDRQHPPSARAGRGSLSQSSSDGSGTTSRTTPALPVSSPGSRKAKNKS